MTAKKTVRRPQRPSTGPQTEPEVDEDEELDDVEEGAESDEETPETPDPQSSKAVAATEPEHIPGAPHDGRTFVAGQPVYFKGESRGNSIIVTENVYRASKFPNTDRWKFNLIFGAGTVLPTSRAKLRDDKYFDSIED